MSNKPEKIDDIYVFVATEDDGSEGITGFKSGDTWIPMVCADTTRLESIRPIAHQIARQTGKPIKLIHFSARTEVETIEPKGG